MTHPPSPAVTTVGQLRTDRATTADRRTLWLRWLLLGTAVLQLASPALVGFDQSPPQDPVLVPPQPWFVVWAPITFGCLAVALTGLAPRLARDPAWCRLQVPLSLTQLGFVLWLVAAAQAPALTVPVFAVMLVLLLWSLHAVTTPEPPRSTSTTRRVLRAVPATTVGLYAGWTSAALWVNAATVLPGLDPEAGGTGSVVTFAALLAGAVGTLALGVWLSRGQLAYLAAGTWALAGVAVSTARADVLALAALAVVGAVTVLVSALVVRAGLRPTDATSAVGFMTGPSS